MFAAAASSNKKRKQQYGNKPPNTTLNILKRRDLYCLAYKNEMHKIAKLQRWCIKWSIVPFLINWQRGGSWVEPTCRVRYAGAPSAAKER